MKFPCNHRIQLSSRAVFFSSPPADETLPIHSLDQFYRIKTSRSLMLSLLSGTAAFLQYTVSAQSADGNSGLNQANTLVRSYFEAGTQLLYGIGALVGLVGAFKVYRSFDARDGQAGIHAATWFGASIFLVMAATVLKSFYGL